MSDAEETRDFWNRVAADWKIQVGTEGDTNRRLNSDPVLWDFLGDVDGLTVLDAGCGTGYLTAKLHAAGATTIGVDFSEEMVAIARSDATECDFRVDSIDRLDTLADETVDAVVSNYVLMDLPDMEGAIRSLYRVLRPGGHAVLIFSHPCFPGGRAEGAGPDLLYRWSTPYFDRARKVDPPWGHFTSEFTWFHRPLSDYWKAFRRTGFEVTDFEEPRITEDRYHLAESERRIKKSRERPYSVAFRLLKPPS